ncbi:hypothetical protein F3Y22_tig00110694pilonHSYRG00249 [Hibiscus syriacus]|uniref:mannosyl-glycoprotein endo-beta-N-acetylglucosaminidase n=1 Tax=Hibiscus syriacus TaxID=106335 RepID=A0A6A2ZX26_HIBSY|nr:hypothetical protein F3Y22_tig00110694pilonHSYRG00249 [Hibiscus syriacus]
MPNQSDDQNSNPPPPPFDRAKPSKPISTLEELDSASYITSFHYPFDKSTVPLRLPDSALPPRHRLLVCHDMQGGYVDDNWVQGGNNSGAYAIWHWESNLQGTAFDKGVYSQTNVALDVIKKDDVSAALFAPGWIYETKQPPDFQTSQNRWWDLVEKSWGIAQNYPKSMSNLLENSYSLPSQIPQAYIFNEASFSGGGNLTFKGTLEANAYVSTRLILGELVMVGLPVNFTYSVKSGGNSQVGLSLEFSSELLIASHGLNQFSSKFDEVIVARNNRKILNLDKKTTRIKQHTSPFLDTLEFQLRYKTRYFLHQLPGSSRVRISNGEVPKVQKLLVLKPAGTERRKEYPFSKIQYLCGETNKTSKGAGEYIGTAQVEAFYVSNLIIPSASSSLKFIIQPCDSSGARQDVDDAPFYNTMLKVNEHLHFCSSALVLI